MVIYTIKHHSDKKKQHKNIVKLLHIVKDYQGVLKPLDSFVWEKVEIQFIIWKAICFL